MKNPAPLKPLVIFGYYGAGNFGDELMLDQLTLTLARERPDIPLQVLTLRTGPTAEYSHDRCTVIRLPGGDMGRLRVAWTTLSKAGFLIWGGGTCFTDHEGDGAFKLFALARIAGVPFGYLGVGIDRMRRRSRKWKMRWLLNRAAFVTLRDPASMADARAVVEPSRRSRLHQTADLTYLLDLRKASATGRQLDAAFTIVLSWRELAGLMPEEVCRRSEICASEAVAELAQGRCASSVILLTLGLQDDTAAHHRILRDLRGMAPKVPVRIASGGDPEKAQRVIQNAGIYICGRFHGALAGLVAGVPTVGLGYSRKVETLFEEQAPGRCVSMPLLSSQELKRAIGVALSCPTSTVSMDRLRADARRNVDVLLGFARPEGWID